MQGNDGDDTLLGDAGNDHLDGGDGDDILDGGTGNDKLEGGDGDDILPAGDGNDNLIAGDGDDLLVAGEGNDKLDAGDGDDILQGGAGNDNLIGGEGDDVLAGGTGTDQARGGEGNDSYIANPFDGSDYFDGGSGGGWTDVIQLNPDADPNADPSNPWTISVDGEQVQYDVADHALSLNPDTSGVITFSDGSELTFEGVERIEW